MWFEMKNVQVIDGADNCTYDVFATTDKDFAVLFPDGQDVEFIDDFWERVDARVGERILKAMWNRLHDKKMINGIHGTLFYQLDFKKRFYPTKKESEMVANQ